MVELLAPLLAFLLSSGVAAAAPQNVEANEPAVRSQAERRAERLEQEPRKEQVAARKALTEEGRLAFIRRAQVWVPTDVPAMDLRAGPQGPGAFLPDEMVTCDYVETKRAGSSRKFDCRIGDGDVVKIRYGADNGEVQAAVLASRLLWALGFSADRVYPVRLTCRGCSSDPWTKPDRAPGEQVFDRVVIERKPDGHEMKSGKTEGWAWPELAIVDEAQGGAPRAHRDALTLLAVLLQHTDSKAQQQRLLCLPGGMEPDGRCEKPFLGVHDAGLTFGRANFANRAATGSVNFDEWARTRIWRDPVACVGDLSRSYTGTLEDPKISEAGRAFLAGLLVQLTDHQLRDLFEVAGVTFRSRKPNSSKPPASVDEWVAAFKHKRDEIVASHCRS